MVSRQMEIAQLVGNNSTLIPSVVPLVIPRIRRVVRYYLDVLQLIEGW